MGGGGAGRLAGPGSGGIWRGKMRPVSRVWQRRAVWELTPTHPFRTSAENQKCFSRGSAPRTKGLGGGCSPGPRTLRAGIAHRPSPHHGVSAHWCALPAPSPGGGGGGAGEGAGGRGPPPLSPPTALPPHRASQHKRAGRPARGPAPLPSRRPRRPRAGARRDGSGRAGLSPPPAAASGSLRP